MNRIVGRRQLARESAAPALSPITLGAVEMVLRYSSPRARQAFRAAVAERYAEVREVTSGQRVLAAVDRVEDADAAPTSLLATRGAIPYAAVAHGIGRRLSDEVVEELSTAAIELAQEKQTEDPHGRNFIELANFARALTEGQHRRRSREDAESKG